MDDNVDDVGDVGDVGDVDNVDNVDDVDDDNDDDDFHYIYQVQLSMARSQNVPEEDQAYFHVLISVYLLL